MAFLEPVIVVATFPHVVVKIEATGYLLPETRIAVGGMQRERACQVHEAVVHDVEDELVALSLASEKVIIDLNEAGYISNAMIRSFLELQHLMDAKNGELILKGLSDDVFRVFEDMGVEDVFMIERSGQ